MSENLFIVAGALGGLIPAQGLPQPATFQQAIGMGLVGLAILFLLGLTGWSLARQGASPFGSQDQPLPNLLLGWSLLWLISGVLLWAYPFPDEIRMSTATQAPIMAGQLVAREGGATEELPAGAEIMVNNGCGACHTVEGIRRLNGSVGPDLTQVGENAAVRIQAADYTGAATTATEYIHESIVEPNAHIAAGFSPVMPSFETTLSFEELQTVVDYLSSLE